jgi:hypothetical protein
MTPEERRVQLLAKYGPHVDEITLYAEPVRDRPGVHDYWATCATHGTIAPRTRDMDERRVLVTQHLKGLT